MVSSIKSVRRRDYRDHRSHQPLKAWKLSNCNLAHYFARAQPIGVCNYTMRIVSNLVSDLTGAAWIGNVLIVKEWEFCLKPWPWQRVAVEEEFLMPLCVVDRKLEEVENAKSWDKNPTLRFLTRVRAKRTTQKGTALEVIYNCNQRKRKKWKWC